MKANPLINYTWCVVACVLLSLACEKKKDEPKPAPAPTDGMVKIGEGIAKGSGAKVEVYSEVPLFVGYNRLYFKLTDTASGKIIDDSHIHLHPEMDMGMKKHGAPVGEVTDKATNTLFSGAVIFTMPSGSMGNWKLGVHVHNHLNNKEGETDIRVLVTTPGKALLKMLRTSDDSTRIIAALVSPLKPKVGINDFVLAIYSKKGEYEYPVAKGYTVEIKPDMPSMGHGSPNNVNPTFGNNLYSGKVNFTMNGDWVVAVTLKKNGATVASFGFDIFLP